MKRRLIGLTFICMLLGCSGGKGTTRTTVDITQLEPPVQSAHRLDNPSKSVVETHLKNGLHLQLNQNNLCSRDSALGGISVSSPADERIIEVGKSSSLYSTTNIHISGVDEADVAKYGG